MNENESESDELKQQTRFRLNPETLCWVFFSSKFGLFDHHLTTCFLIFCHEFFLIDQENLTVEYLKSRESYKCCMDEKLIIPFITDDLIQEMIDFELD